MTWWHLPLQVHPLLSSDLILPLSPSTCCCLIGNAVSCLWASVCAHLTWPAPTCGLVLSPSSSPLGPLHKCHPAPLAEFPVYSLPQHTWVPLLCHLLTGWSLFKIWLPFGCTLLQGCACSSLYLPHLAEYLAYSRYSINTGRINISPLPSPRQHLIQSRHSNRLHFILFLMLLLSLIFKRKPPVSPAQSDPCSPLRSYPQIQVTPDTRLLHRQELG